MNGLLYDELCLDCIHLRRVFRHIGTVRCDCVSFGLLFLCNDDYHVLRERSACQYGRVRYYVLLCL